MGAMDVLGTQGVATTADGILNGVIFVVGGIVIFGIVFLIGKWYMDNIHRYKQFNCIIFQRNGFGQLEQKKDQAGIFTDGRTKNKRLFLKNSKVGLDPDNVPYISTKGSKTIYLLQTGLKNFRFINIDIKEPLIDMTVGEEDVNWAINAYERQKALFQDSKWMQLLPFIAIAFVSIIILTIFIYFFKNFDVLQDVALALERTAQEIAKANADTIIVDGVLV